LTPRKNRRAAGKGDVQGDVPIASCGMTQALTTSTLPIENTDAGSASQDRPVTNGRFLLTVTEAAGILGISRAYAYRLVAAGELPTVRIGSLRRVRLSDLVAYVDSLGLIADPVSR
jgi:excisionase family DNA binding protein